MEKKSQYEQVCSKKPVTARRERRHDIHQPTHKDKHKAIHEERHEETHPTAEPAETSTQLGVRWSEDVHALNAAVGCYGTLTAAVCERYDQSSKAKRKLVLLELEVGFLIHR